MEKQIQQGITGLVIAGSTGEGSLLSNETYQLLLEKAVEISRARVPIVAGLGIGGTAECLARGKIAKATKASALLASPPAYIKTPARGLVKHYQTLTSLELPLCLYDVPSRSAVGLPDEVIDELLADKVASPYIHALKDATGKPERIKNKSEWKKRIAVLSGDDESFPAFIEAGGHGVISVATHFALPEFIAVLKKEKGCLERFSKTIPFIQGLYWEANPIPTKSLAFELEWIAADTFQEPLCPMKKDLLEKLYELHRENFH